MNKTMLARVLCNPTNSTSSRKQQGNRVCKRILILFGFLKSRLAPQNKICIHQNSFASSPACYLVGLVNRKPSHGWGLWRDHTERETHFEHNSDWQFERSFSNEKNHYNTERCRQWLKLWRQRNFLSLYALDRHCSTSFLDLSQLKDQDKLNEKHLTEK